MAVQFRSSMETTSSCEPVDGYCLQINGSPHSDLQTGSNVVSPEVKFRMFYPGTTIDAFDMYVHTPEHGTRVNTGTRFGSIVLRNSSPPCNQDICNPSSSACPGSTQYEAATKLAEVGRVGQAIVHLGAVRKLCDMQAAVNQVFEDANTDALTGLPNHEGFPRLLTSMVEHVFISNDSVMIDDSQEEERQQPSDILIIAIDLRNFKDTNDTFGHLVGDEVLRRFAQFLPKNIRKEDIAGRLHGDEFMLALRATSRADIDIIERLCKEFELIVFDIGSEGEVIETKVTARIGSKTLSDHLNDIGISMSAFKAMGLYEKELVLKGLLKSTDDILTAEGQDERMFRRMGADDVSVRILREHGVEEEVTRSVLEKNRAMTGGRK